MVSSIFVDISLSMFTNLKEKNIWILSKLVTSRRKKFLDMHGLRIFFRGGGDLGAYNYIGNFTILNFPGEGGVTDSLPPFDLLLLDNSL